MSSFTSHDAFEMTYVPAEVVESSIDVNKPYAPLHIVTKWLRNQTAPDPHIIGILMRCEEVVKKATLSELKSLTEQTPPLPVVMWPVIGPIVFSRATDICVQLEATKAHLAASSAWLSKMAKAMIGARIQITYHGRFYPGKES